jgi:hypothetical protein
MRSSKSRSRSKSNRNRPSGNIINRVFESSGPEGKVRGTPQQIIEKYNQLARDAQLSNDRVAFENFQQHAEHYTRLLNEAMREMDTRRDGQDRDGQDRDQQDRDTQDRDYQDRDQQGRDQQGRDQQGRDQQGRDQQGRDQQDRDRSNQGQQRRDDRTERRDHGDGDRSDRPDTGRSVDEVIDTGVGSGADDGPGLVETPENAEPPRPKRQRRPRAKAVEGQAPAASDPAPDDTPENREAAE